MNGPAVSSGNTDSRDCTSTATSILSLFSMHILHAK